jgi:hypothetical protein
MRWISRSRRGGRHGPAEDEADASDRQIGFHRGRQRRLGHAGQPRVFGLRGRVHGDRPLRIVGHFRGELGQPDVAARKIEGGGRADRGAPVDESRTIHGHDDVAGVGVGMAQPVAWPQPLDQVEDAGGDMFWNSGAGDPQPAVHHVAQKGYVRRRGRLVNGPAEGGEDRARLPEADGAAAHELQQGRSLEATEHDAKAPLQLHLAEHLRRRGAGGEDGAGHPRLPPAFPSRRAGLQQLHDLTGRPGVDVRKDAFADLLPQGSPHRPSSRCGGANTSGAQKRTPFSRGRRRCCAVEGLGIGRFDAAGSDPNEDLVSAWLWMQHIRDAEVDSLLVLTCGSMRARC